MKADRNTDHSLYSFLAILLVLILLISCRGCSELVKTERATHDTIYVDSPISVTPPPGMATLTPSSQVTIHSTSEVYTPWYSKVITTLGFLVLLATIIWIIYKLHSLQDLL